MLNDLLYTGVVDCSHPISPEMPHWPGDPVTGFSACASPEADGFYLRSFAMSEHAGTHCNAPNTFYPDGKDIAAILTPPPVLPVAVADFSGVAAQNDLACFMPEHLQNWELQFGRVPEGCLFLLNTGWGSKWKEPAVFLGLHDERGDRLTGCSALPSGWAMRFPAFSPEVAELLVSKRRVAGIGIDTHGADSPADDTFSVNRCVLRADRLVLECLANLDKLPPLGAVAAVGGLKLAGGTGCPVAVTVFLPPIPPVA
ncbi:cyclase family protein [Desulfovibrio mangrovi]|uniref:cyclase family protein n=1 Tax=Desulfovibrio mangrovi TaxID=2976983 RepID=UPI002247E047|nr:cyclase family protein [Desulfovibrio mangrovi]UZP69119.1 cyclase family protein [Desulfovibrio mangrovi]